MNAQQAPRLSKRQKHILAIADLQNRLERAAASLRHNLDNEAAGFSLGLYSVVLVAAFLDEWKDIVTLAETDPILASTVAIAKPAVDRASRWSDLKKFRHRIAHNPTNCGRLIPITKIFQSDVPTTFGEHLVLANAALLATQVVCHIHRDELADAKRLFKTIYGEIPDRMDKGVVTREEAINDIEATIKEVFEVANNHGAALPEIAAFLPV